MSDKKESRGESRGFSAKTLEKLRTWGGPSELSAFEAMMWLAEADPHLRSTTTSVMELDSTPDWSRLVAGHEWTTRAAPRLRQKVMEPAFGLDMPAWVDDPEFLLDYHLRRVRLPEPGTRRQLFDFAQTVAMTPFDRCRPPWEAVLVEGLEGGKAAYILKLHHAISDGIGIMQLIGEALNASRDGRDFPALKPTRKPRATSSLELAAKGAFHRFLDLPHGTTDSFSSLLDMAATLLKKPDAMREATDYLTSAKRMLATKPAAGSPILRKRSLGNRFDSFEFALADFKAASKSLGASLNDVFLAGLMGGFRRYHEEMGVSIDRMPIGFPISLRTENDAAGGNKFAGAQYPAPVGEKDPLKRIEHIQKFVRTAREEPALDVVLKIAPVMVHLPTPVLTTIAANMTAAQDAQVSNIPGVPHALHMAGAHVTHLWPFAPTVGCGMMIAMVSHNGRCCIGINSDRAAVTEPELLAECLYAGIEEMLQLKKPTSAARPASGAATKPASKLTSKAPVARAPVHAARVPAQAKAKPATKTVVAKASTTGKSKAAPKVVPKPVTKPVAAGKRNTKTVSVKAPVKAVKRAAAPTRAVAAKSANKSAASKPAASKLVAKNAVARTSNARKPTAKPARAKKSGTKTSGSKPSATKKPAAKPAIKAAAPRKRKA